MLLVETQRMYRTEEFSLKQIDFSVKDAGKLMLFIVWEGKKGSHVSTTTSTKSSWVSTALSGSYCPGVWELFFCLRNVDDFVDCNHSNWILLLLRDERALLSA